jgi:hypothetical protein
VYLRNNSSILYDSTRQGYTVYSQVLQIVMNIKFRIGFKCPKTYFAVEIVWRTLHNMFQIYVFNRVVELKLLTYLILIVTCYCIHLIYWAIYHSWLHDKKAFQEWAFLAVGTRVLIPLQEDVRIYNLCIAYHVFYNKIMHNNAYSRNFMKWYIYAFDNG